MESYMESYVESYMDSHMVRPAIHHHFINPPPRNLPAAPSWTLPQLISKKQRFSYKMYNKLVGPRPGSRGRPAQTSSYCQVPDHLPTRVHRRQGLLGQRRQRGYRPAPPGRVSPRPTRALAGALEVVITIIRIMIMLLLRIQHNIM